MHHNHDWHLQKYRELLSGLFHCVDPQVRLCCYFHHHCHRYVLIICTIIVIVPIAKVGNWEGGEVEEYNRAITASKWVDHDDIYVMVECMSVCLSRFCLFCLPPAKLAKAPPGTGYNLQEQVYNLQELFITSRNRYITSRNSFITSRNLW